MKEVLITGGSGLVGSRLTEILNQNNYKVRHLSRSKTPVEGAKVFKWDIETGFIEEGALQGVSAIVHLAGAGIGDKRWTDERKRTIINSRVDSAKLLEDHLRKEGISPDAFISASGINYYGAVTTDKVFNENDAAGNDFIGHCCVLWEEQANKFQDICRVVKLRTAVVLSSEGGALSRIAMPIRFGFGSPLGSGKQWMPFIHREDLCRMYLYAIEENINGVFNAVSSDYNTNKDFTKKAAAVLNKPLWMPNVPAFAIRAAFGEMGDIVLEGSRASNDKIKDAGYKFNYEILTTALSDALKE